MATQKAYGLTSQGKEVVAKEAQNYRDFDLIFSSPFRRTQETAAFFAETSKCDVILDDRLVDVDLGDLDLQSYEISSAYTKEHSSNDYVYPNGESFSQVFKRLMNFMNDVNSRYKKKEILIVSHGFPCETLLDWINGIPLRDWSVCIQKGKIFRLNV